MTESYIYYTSIVLFALGLIALVMAVLFRQRSKRLNDLPKELSPAVFGQTFVVFNPYPAQKKLWHRFLSLLPFVCLAVSVVVVIAMWSMLTNSLLLPAFVIVVGLNIIVIEEAPEVFMTARIFIKAVQNKTELAKGDLKVLKIIQRVAPRMRDYYVGLTILFIATSLVLLYGWEALPSSVPWIGDPRGIVILFILIVALLQFAVFKLKNKMFRYEIK